MENATAGFMRQVGVCFGRCKRAFVNDRGWKVFVSVVLITLLVGMVMGEYTFVGYEDTKNGAYALVCACIWIGIFNSVRSVCRERDIVRREHRTGLNVGPTCWPIGCTRHACVPWNRCWWQWSCAL